MKKQEFENLVESIRQAGQIRRGEAQPSRVVEFARMIGVSVSTLQNWEQGRRRPDGPARALLRVAAANPDAVAAALAN
jgi:putative transcriptional regulator